MVDVEIKNPVLNEVNIDTSFLIEYHYGSVCPEFPGDDTIYLKIDGSESASDSQTNIGHLKLIRVSETKKFLIDDYTKLKTYINCTIMVSTFTRVCTSFPEKIIFIISLS